MLTRIIDKCIVFEVPYANLDAVNSKKFKQKLLNTYLSSSFSDMVLNLEKVTFIDASGLEALLFAGSLIQEEKGKISLCCVNSYVRQVLMKTRLYRFFDINRTVEDSLEFIKDSELVEFCNYQVLRSKLRMQTA